MKVLGRDKLDEFLSQHTAAKGALETLFNEMENALWIKPQDIKDRYRSVDFLKNNRVIFDIKGNHYRLVVKISYPSSIVVIEWIGTHSEYSKKSF